MWGDLSPPYFWILQFLGWLPAILLNTAIFWHCTFYLPWTNAFGLTNMSSIVLVKNDLPTFSCLVLATLRMQAAANSGAVPTMEFRGVVVEGGVVLRQWRCLWRPRPRCQFDRDGSPRCRRSIWCPARVFCFDKVVMRLLLQVRRWSQSARSIFRYVMCPWLFWSYSNYCWIQ